jgi:serine/threonine protein kinase
MLTSGRQVGPYEVLGAIGAGAMGEVYRVRDSRLQRDVAIKVLPRAVVPRRRRPLPGIGSGRLRRPHRSGTGVARKGEEVYVPGRRWGQLMAADVTADGAFRATTPARGAIDGHGSTVILSRIIQCAVERRTYPAG